MNAYEREWKTHLLTSAPVVAEDWGCDSKRLPGYADAVSDPKRTVVAAHSPVQPSMMVDA